MSSFSIRKGNNYIVSSASFSNVVYDPSSNWTFNANNIYNNNSGNVGVGTSTPQALLDVNGQTILRTPIVKIGVNAGTNNAISGNIAIGNSAGANVLNGCNVSIGPNAGNTGAAANCIAIGNSAGNSNHGTRGGTNNAIAIGGSAGQTSSGFRSVCIGGSAGSSNCGGSAVNLGLESGQANQTGENHVAIGRNAGRTNQSSNAIAIGCNAGGLNQGSNSIAIGLNASTSFSGNSIVLNATGNLVSADASSALFIRSIDSSTGTTNLLIYNPSSGKISYNATKTFVIDHPLDENKYLVHACLEGPEAGVYYRGTGEITNGKNVEISLPEYTKPFYNFTIQVSPVGSPNNLYCSKVENGKFTVFGNNGKFYWTVIGTREEINVEPMKEDVTIKGDGPYRYIV